MTNSAPQPVSDFAAARRMMIANQLRPQGVTDARVLAAMGSIAREDFVGPDRQARAYGDRPLRLGDQGSMMPPAELGQLLNRLAPQAGQRALVVGKGGAYAAAVLRQIGLEVHTADGEAESGSGTYDLILVEGAIDQFPATLARCLARRGRVGAAIVEDGVTRLAIGRGGDDRDGSGTVAFTSFAEAQIPVDSGVRRAPVFSF